MKTICTLLFLILLATTAAAGGQVVAYDVKGEAFEGDFTSPADNAPFVLLIHG